MQPVFLKEMTIREEDLNEGKEVEEIEEETKDDLSNSFKDGKQENRSGSPPSHLKKKVTLRKSNRNEIEMKSVIFN